MADYRSQISPEPKGKAVAITFDGPVQSLYSTLAARLGHSGLFTTGRAEMWRNAAVFTAKAGGKCGLFLHEFAEGRDRLILFFPYEHSSAETWFHFEEFVLAHARLSVAEGRVPTGTCENSPAFQRWERVAARRQVPDGTTEAIRLFLLSSLLGLVLFSTPAPPLKRWALAGRSCGA